MSHYWKIAIPGSVTNFVINPSLEGVDTNVDPHVFFLWTEMNAPTITIATTGLFGQRSAQIINKSTTANRGLYQDVNELQNGTSYQVTVWVQPLVGFVQLIAYDGGGTSNPVSTNSASGPAAWQRLSVTKTATANGIRVALIAPNAESEAYFDGVMVSVGSFDYVDGSFPDASWTGTPHLSQSVGPKLLDLASDLDFIVADTDGTGMPPFDNLASPLALQPGELFERQNVRARPFTLNGSIVAETQADFHNGRRALIAALGVNTGKINQRPVPRTFRYTGAPTHKEIRAVYDGGLEFGLPQGWANTDVRLRLLAHDPFFYQVGRTNEPLDTSDGATVRNIARRGADGLWSGLGPPSSAGSVVAIAEDEIYIYVGGNFTNWDGNADSDYIARYNKVTKAWSNLGTGLNGICRDLTVGPNGNIYAAGEFTTAGGVTHNRIAKWDGAAWSAVATGVNFNDTCHAIAFASDGTLYAVGAFTTASGTTVNRAAKVAWGGAWERLSTAGANLDATAYAVDIDRNGVVYIGGNFSTVNAFPAPKIIGYAGSAYFFVGPGLPDFSSIRAIKVSASGDVFAGGELTSGDTSRLRVWNGNAWETPGVGISETVRTLDEKDGVLYIGGVFELGPAGTNHPSPIALWNGNIYTMLDIILPSSANVFKVYVNELSQVLLGFDTGGTGTFSGDTTISYEGTAPAYPTITVMRSGGTSARIISIRNETTGAVLYINYALLDGESVTIDTRPTRQSFTSDFRGEVNGAIFPGSDFGQFYLAPGNELPHDNIITAFVEGVGSPTITAAIEYRTAYLSED